MVATAVFGMVLRSVRRRQNGRPNVFERLDHSIQEGLNSSKHRSWCCSLEPQPVQLCKNELKGSPSESTSARILSFSFLRYYSSGHLHSSETRLLSAAGNVPPVMLPTLR